MILRYTNYYSKAIEIYEAGVKRFKLDFNMNNYSYHKITLSTWTTVGWAEIAESKLVEKTEIDAEVPKLLELAVIFNDGE